MKAYNQQEVENIHHQQIIEDWHSRGLLSDEQLAKSINAFPVSFYRPNIFVKAGLFLFTALASICGAGFISIFFIEILDNASLRYWSILAWFYALLFGVFLEFFIKQRKLFHSGVDNALLYATLSCFLAGIFFIIQDLHFPLWLSLGFCLPFLFLTIIRYSELLTGFITYVCFWAIVCLLSVEFPLGKIILPFVIIILSGGVYLLIKKIQNLEQIQYYNNVLTLFETASLVLFYLGGNYLIVREGNALINNIFLNVSPQISFAPFFYLFTAFIPLVYIYLGLKKKDRILLVTGLLAVVFSIITYRFYFSNIPKEIALTIAGAMMIILSVFLNNYLKKGKWGITAQATDSSKLSNFESLLVAQVFGQAPQQKGMEFGGGDFGGGGAGDKY